MLDCVMQIQRHCENTSVTLSNVETPADPLVESVNVEVSDRHGNCPVSMRGRYVNVLLIRTEICFK